MLDVDECPCSGRTLTRLLRPALLTLLAREPGHGYALMQRLEQLASFASEAPDAAGVYRVLRSMEKEGLVESDWETPEHGPARKCFSLTADGRNCLSAWVETLRLYQSSVGELISLAESRCDGPEEEAADGAGCCTEA